MYATAIDHFIAYVRFDYRLISLLSPSPILDCSLALLLSSLSFSPPFPLLPPLPPLLPLLLLSSPPPLLAQDLTEQREYMKTIPEFVGGTQDRISKAMSDYDMIEDYCHPLSNEDFEAR